MFASMPAWEASGSARPRSPELPSVESDEPYEGKHVQLLLQLLELQKAKLRTAPPGSKATDQWVTDASVAHTYYTQKYPGIKPTSEMKDAYKDVKESAVKSGFIHLGRLHIPTNVIHAMPNPADPSYATHVFVRLTPAGLKACLGPS